MTVFGTDIPYDSVRVHDHGWEGFLGLQFDDTFLAPDGDIYVRRDGPYYSDDFSIADFRLQATFIHEMAHVWQVRTKNINLKSRRIVEYDYDYTIKPGKRFLDYQVEQQASMVGDYFRFLHGQEPKHGRPFKDGEALKGEAALNVYRRLLPFLNHIWT